MIRGRINELEFEVSFRHSPPDEGRRITTAILVIAGLGWGPLIKRRGAVCDPRDNFCRSTGRKIALARVLDEAGLTKQERGAVWLAYHHRDDWQQPVVIRHLAQPEEYQRYVAGRGEH